MKRIIGIALFIILVSYLLLLHKYLMIEEILGFFIIPMIVVVIVSSPIYFIILIFRRISYKTSVTNSLVAACILQILIATLILWSVAPRYFLRNQVINDIDYAIKVMENVHPDLYSAISKEAFFLKTDSLKRSMPEKVSDAEVYRTLLKVFSQIQDGHTGAGWNFFLNRGAGLFRKTLPYKLNIKNERIFVSKNYFYRNTIPVGSEIIAINGKSASQCLEEISQFVSYESLSFRDAILQTPMFWGLWNDFNDFKITYRTLDNATTKTINTSGGLLCNILFIKDMNLLGVDYSFRVISGNIAYVEFNSFKDLDRFKAFLRSTFKQIKDKGLSELIIDIRKNGGGSSLLGDELMQYISRIDFTMFDSCMIKISHELTQEGDLDWVDSTKRIIGSIYDAHDSSKTKLRENPLRYSGQSYLLVGGYTFSSASTFASAFQCYKVGKIIGTETGGLTVCFGDVYSFELPNTKFDMGVSCKQFFSACGVDNRRGVVPDFIVENTLEDEQKGMDRVLEFTVNLIKQNKK
jgi:hypothetical protein